jgi:hypothetical protein
VITNSETNNEIKCLDHRWTKWHKEFQSGEAWERSLHLEFYRECADCHYYQVRPV